LNKIGKRIIVSASDIRISSPKNVFILIFMPVWLAAWTFAGAMVFWQVFSGQSKEAWSLVLWLLGWLAGELFVIYALLWGAFGYELITLEHGMITIKDAFLVMARQGSLRFPRYRICGLRGFLRQ